MLRLLIVEDEKAIRETISTIINWQEHDIELIGACANGIEAFDMIMDEYPDIVLTDIRMPGLDGLGLIERVRGMDMGIEFIILSGYGEFEYAKSAMRFGVREYLLKPCNQVQILEAITNVKRHIVKRVELENIQQQAEQSYEEFSTAIKKQFTVEAITGTGDFSSIMTRYGGLLSFPHGEYHLYYVTYLEENNLPDFVDFIAAMKKKFSFSFCFNVLYVKNTALLMLCMNNDTAKDGFEQALTNMPPQEKQVQIAWWEEPYETVQDMLAALVHRVQRYSRIILVDDDHSFHEIYNYVTSMRKTQSVAKALEEICSESEIAKLVDEIFLSVEDVDLAIMFAMRLVVQISTEAHLLPNMNMPEFLSKLYNSATVPDIRTLTLEQLLHLFQEKERTLTNYKDFVQRAVDYVNENVSDPHLSMKWIAENYLYMNVDYFSRQFVKETGEKFSAYLNRVRMEKAKELILQLDSNLIYKVAEQVGCGHNPQYFSQLFKKWTGYTPSGYREMYK